MKESTDIHCMIITNSIVIIIIIIIVVKFLWNSKRTTDDSVNLAFPRQVVCMDELASLQSEFPTLKSHLSLLSSPSQPKPSQYYYFKITIQAYAQMLLEKKNEQKIN